MKGLSTRKGSENWQGWFRIPEPLWGRRRELVALGVTDIRKSQEFKKSLGTANREEAAQRYRLALEAWERKMGAWAALLDAGPTKLTHRQRVALAADYAKAFLVRHEDEPFDAPGLPPFPEAPDARSWPWARAAISRLSAEERRRFVRDLRAWREAKEETERAGRGFALVKAYPFLGGPGLATALEEMHGADTAAALAAHGLHVDKETHLLIDLELEDFKAAAQLGLEARRDGDYRPVERLEAAPAFTPSAPGKALPPALRLETLLDHKSSTRTIKAKTVDRTRSHIRKFVAFIGHDDARRVTKDDVRRWRDALIGGGELATHTISDRYLSSISSVLEHGVREFDLPSNVAAGIKDNRAVPTKGVREYSAAQAVEILTATFRGSEKDISAPHRRAIFWVPWIMAYTGLRVREVTQFRARHLREESGVPYLLITPEDGSTKSGKVWMVAIHQHLLDLGLVDFLRSFGDGPMFYEPYPRGTDLKTIKGRHRAEDAAVRVGNWVTDEVGIVAPLGRPNHAWRHLFTTRSRQFDMNKEARDFMMGSGAGDAREGYGDWPPERLAKEINKLPRFPVKDTGWRP